MFLSLRNIFCLFFFFSVWYKARNKRVFKYVYLSGKVIFFFNITLICKYVWSFQILYLFESVWLEIKDISNRNIKWWNEFHSSVLFTLLWLKICCGLHFKKKKSTNNFQMNLEKNEILNGSIYHYMIYILISH